MVYEETYSYALDSRHETAGDPWSFWIATKDKEDAFRAESFAA